MTGDKRFVAVIDIGKTNAKLVVFDLVTQQEVTQLSIANKILSSDLYPSYNVQALWQFIVDGLVSLSAKHRIDAITITTHGACAALLDESGHLALPILDYEYDGPQSTAHEYDSLRPAFSETGSPRLPNGLNLGAQLFWQAQLFPHHFAKVRRVVTYPQYWAYLLCGVLANEATSLGCHTDLWAYNKNDYSTFVSHMNWQRLMPALRKASDNLGPLLPHVASATGLPLNTTVYCGIHDSNASLLPHILNRTKPFAVVSTGTWVISMAIGGKHVVLDPARDTLVNVNALGDPVFSARFMGGREFELLQHLFGAEPVAADVNIVLQKQIMVLPSLVRGCGPYPNNTSRWLNDAGSTPQQKQVAASFYLALMAATCLDLTGAEGDVIVEGPFASNVQFTSMLSAATGRSVYRAETKTGTSFGAALLCDVSRIRCPTYVSCPPCSVAHVTYAKNWRAKMDRV